jgi:hypothetical protein
VKFVDPADQHDIDAGCGAGPEVDAARADPECSCLTGYRQIIARVDHRLALGNSSALSSALPKKSFALPGESFRCSDTQDDAKRNCEHT